MCTKNMIVVHGLSLWDIIPYPTQCWESWTLEIQHGSSTWWFGKGVSFRTPYSNGAHFNIQSLVCNYKKQETSGFTSYKLHRRSSTNKNSRGTRQTNKTGGTSQLARPVLCWKFALWAFSWPQGALLLVSGDEKGRRCRGGNRDVDMNDIEWYWESLNIIDMNRWKWYVYGKLHVFLCKRRTKPEITKNTDSQLQTLKWCPLVFHVDWCNACCIVKLRKTKSPEDGKNSPPSNPTVPTLKIGTPQDFQRKNMSPDHGSLQELLVKEIQFFWWRKSYFCEKLNPGMQSWIFFFHAGCERHFFDVH